MPDLKSVAYAGASAYRALLTRATLKVHRSGSTTIAGRPPSLSEFRSECSDSRFITSEVSWKPEVIEVAAQPISKELKKRWSYFIRKVYETDPLTCPKCQGDIRIISFINQPEVIKKILQHLGFEKSLTPRRIETQRKKRLLLIPGIPS